MRNPHLKSVVAIDTPSATSTDDAGKIPVLGDSGRLDSAFLQAILESIGDLSSNGIICRTSATTVAARTLTAPPAGITVSNGDGVSGNPTLALANDLAALEGLGSTGFATRTGADAWAQRTLTAPAAGFTITNPAGVAGDPTFVLANDLAALEGLASTGIAVRTGSDAWAQRTIEGTAGSVNVTNGNGVGGNPVISLDSTFVDDNFSLLFAISKGYYP